jgi:two-component system OmpR family response regulator
VLLDWMLPGIDGLGVLQRLREEQLTVPVIMLTALNRLPEKVEGLSAGADDYVTKPASAEEINARIHAVIRGRQWQNRPSDIRICGDVRISPARIRAWRGDRALDLSPIDFKLLSELVDSDGAVLTRAMLVERVWGFDFEPTTNIVDSHIRRLRLELTRGGEEDPIITVRGVGYMLST